MDDLAAELGIEPLELRARNWIAHEEFPYSTLAGLQYDSGNYEAATAKARELFRYDELRQEQSERNSRGDPVRLGIGISTFTEMCGLALAGRGRHGPGRGLRQGHREGPGDRRGHDRGLGRRHGVDAGAVRGPRRP